MIIRKDYNMSITKKITTARNHCSNFCQGHCVHLDNKCLLYKGEECQYFNAVVVASERIWNGFKRSYRRKK